MTRVFQWRVAVCALCAIVLMLGTSTFADDTAVDIDGVQPTNLLAVAEVHSSMISWQPKVAYEAVVLTISGPDGFYQRIEYPAEKSLVLSLDDEQLGKFSDGVYTYELVFTPAIDDATKKAMQTSRDNDDPDIVRDLKRLGKLPTEALKTSMTFTVVGGRIVDPSKTETAPTKDIVHLDDVIVQYSLCVGNDCVNGESFGFDTLRMKENNIRVHFQDTSTSASFPSNDWRLVANDSSNGGNNYFAIEDSNTSRQVFRVAAGARANSLVVDSAGDVGLGNSNPVVNLHVTDGNTPTLRLEQDGSSGFTPQTWDVAGNEANFFIRDATNGSRLPFQIKPGAASASLYIAADGDIGLGTTSPSDGARLHVLANTAGAGAVDTLLLENNGPARVRLKNTGAADDATHNQQWVLNSNGTFRISAGADAAEMVLDAAGDLTILGSLTESSDFNLKENFASLDAVDVLAKVLDLSITSWNFKANDTVSHVGPMAQDFYAAFGFGPDSTKISSRDVASIALLAIQALHQDLEQKDQEIRILKEQVQLLLDRASE